MAKTNYTADDFLSEPSGEPCPTCKKREGDKQFFGSCRPCAALVFNDAGRGCNKREADYVAKRFETDEAGGA